MGIRDFWEKYKEWVAVLAFIIMLFGFTMWYLLLNPQHIPLFLATTIVALSFVAAMALLPKYRQRFVEKILAYQTKDKERGGWLHRYGIPLTILFYFNMLFFYYVLYRQFIPSDIIPYFGITFIAIQLVIGAAVIACVIRAIGKWKYLYLAILGATTIAVYFLAHLLGI